MKEYFSNQDPKKLLLKVINISESTEKRMELIPENFPVQLSLRNLSDGLNIKAHKHLNKTKFSENPIEAWMIFSGSVRATIFENSDAKIYTVDLNSMDLAIFYGGGHSLEVTRGPATMLEIKTGPYEGAGNDKIFIN